MLNKFTFVIICSALLSSCLFLNFDAQKKYEFRGVVDKETINTYNDEFLTPLLVSILNSDYKKANKLIDMGADVDLPTKKARRARMDLENITPIMIAIEKNEFKIVDLLLKKGARINIKNSDGDTVLMKAAKLSDVKILKELVSYGAYINNVNIYGENTLMNAVKGGKYENVVFLVNNGVNLNQKEKNIKSFNGHKLESQEKGRIVSADQMYKWRGDTPLMVAVRNKDKNIAEVLISHGADKTLKNGEGKTARQIAKEEAPELLSLF